ncbi:MAG: hypothetical protein WCE68_15185, partial [Anaerolineales bacterium]
PQEQIPYSSCTIHHSPFTIHHSPFPPPPIRFFFDTRNEYRSSFIIHHSSFQIPHSSFPRERAGRFSVDPRFEYSPAFLRLTNPPLSDTLDPWI